MPETSVIEVAPYGTNHRPPRVVWRLTLPKTPGVVGRVEVGNREDALRLAQAIAGKYGWTVREWTPEGDEEASPAEHANEHASSHADSVPLRDNELERLRLRLQAGDILARLFPAVECVLLDHVDELTDDKGRVDANLAELATVYRELTGFDARAATSEETNPHA